MKVNQKILGLTVVAMMLGGLVGVAEDAGTAKDAKPVKKLPRCFVDKNGNGKCDKSVADGGKCKANHVKPVAGAVAPTDSTKKAGDKTSFITCPGQGLCLACGLCNNGKA